MRLEEVIRKIREKLREQGQKDRKKLGGGLLFCLPFLFFYRNFVSFVYGLYKFIQSTRSKSWSFEARFTMLCSFIVAKMIASAGSKACSLENSVTSSRISLGVKRLRLSIEKSFKTGSKSISHTKFGFCL